MTSGLLVPQEKHFYVHVFLVQLIEFAQETKPMCHFCTQHLEHKDVAFLILGSLRPAECQNHSSDSTFFEHSARPPSIEHRAKQAAPADEEFIFWLYNQTLNAS